MDAEVSLDSVLARLTLLEERIAASPFFSSDPNVIVHKPESSFTPPPEVLGDVASYITDLRMARLIAAVAVSNTQPLNPKPL